MREGGGANLREVKEASGGGFWGEGIQNKEGWGREREYARSNPDKRKDSLA